MNNVLSFQINGEHERNKQESVTGPHFIFYEENIRLDTMQLMLKKKENSKVLNEPALEFLGQWEKIKWLYYENRQIREW